MSTLLSESFHIARKDHRCDACDCLLNYRDIEDFDGKDREAIELAKSHGWKILKGERYVRHVGVWHGDFSCFKSIPAIHDICSRYEIFDED